MRNAKLMGAGLCLGGALMIGLAACSDRESANEADQSANSAQQKAAKAPEAAKPGAKAAKPGAKPAAGKCPNLYTQLPVQTPDLTRKVYTCVERYSQLYAKGPDSAEALSKAVMAKCKETTKGLLGSPALRW